MIIIHTSDIHLGAKLGFLEEAAGAQRKKIRNAFSETVNLAISKKADLFLIAGDLFDSNLPARETLNFAITEIKRLVEEQIHVAIIPGNHDNFATTSVYRYNEWQSLNKEYFHLFTEASITVWEIPDLDTVVYAAAVAHKKSSLNQIKDFEPVIADYTYKIGLFHGSVDILSEPDNYPLPVVELKKLPLNYVALGDWHGQLLVNKANPAVWYAGSPELLASDQEKSGKVLLVEISNQGITTVTPYKVSTTIFANCEINIEDFSGLTEVEKYIINEFSNSAETTVLRILLRGSVALSSDLDSEQLAIDLKEKFFKVIIDDQTEVENIEDLKRENSGQLIVGHFLEFLAKRENGDLEKKKIIDRARLLGLKLLKGGQVNADN